MLSSMKQLLSGWVAQLFIGLLVLSFAVWGISDVFTGFGRGAVATVGKEEVTLVQFQRRFDESLLVLQQQTGRVLTPQQAVQLGIPAQVLEVLVAEATLDDTGRVLGLGMSDATLSRIITTDPGVIGPSGVYSQDYLRQVVAAQGYTLDEFVVGRREQYTREQITDALAGGIATPQTFLDAFSEFSGERRTVDYVVIAPPDAATIREPSEAELATFFEETAGGWRAPELRSFTTMILDVDAVARPEDVTDAAIATRYDEQIARFITPERRTIEQIVFDSAEEASAAAARLNGGATFDEIAAQQGLSAADTAIGTSARAAISDGALAEAAFGLEEGGVSGVVDGRFGSVIVQVTEIFPETAQTLDEVADTLRNEIAANIAVAEIDDIVDVIEDARAGGDSLTAVGARFGLDMATFEDVSAVGRDEDGNPAGPFPNAGLVAAVFESDVGLENNPIRESAQSYIWYEVTEVAPPRARPLTEVRDRVVEAWKEEQRSAQAREDAEALLVRLEAGDALDVAAAEFDYTVQTATDVTRGAPDEAGLTRDVALAAFGGPVGHTAIVAEPGTSEQFVIAVVDAAAPAAADSPHNMAAQRLGDQIAVGLIQRFISEARSDRDVHFNQALVTQLLTTGPIVGGHGGGHGAPRPMGGHGG